MGPPLPCNVISLNGKSQGGGGELPLTWTSILSPVKPVGTGFGIKGVFKLYPAKSDIMSHDHVTRVIHAMLKTKFLASAVIDYYV